MLTEEQLESVKEQIKEQVKRANLPEEQTTNFLEWVEHADAEQIEEFLKKQGQQGGGECLFCGIGKGSIETIKIYEDNSIVAFLDITPAAAGQAIIIPKEHYQFIFNVPDQILWDMTRIMKILMPIIVNVTKCQGVSVYIAQGPAAGQRIGHAAINLIPRFEDDKATFAWERKELPKEQLEKAAKEIKMSIEKSFAEEKERIAKKVREEMVSRQKTSAPQEPVEYPRRMA